MGAMALVTDRSADVYQGWSNPGDSEVGDPDVPRGSRPMATMKVRDVSLYVEVIGHGDPVLLMHGGPGLDHVSLTPFRELADRHTVILYDHRCNGRSTGAPVTSMTWDNLTADADALREELGFEQWAVLGHSFGGHVALEYVLRYPERRVAPRPARHGRRRAMVAGERSGGPGGPRIQPKDGGRGSPFLQGPDRSQGLRPRLHAARARLRPPVQPPAARSRDGRGRVADEDAARGTHLRRRR